MSTPSVAITAVIAGAVNRVNLTKTGPTTALVETKVWSAGVNPNGPPSSDNTIDLTNCAAAPDGSVLSADGPSVMWMTAKVTLTISETSESPPKYQAEIVVNGVGPEDSDTKALISAADYAAAQAFIKAAAFPAIS